MNLIEAIIGLIGAVIGWFAGVFLPALPLTAISVKLFREIPFAETLRANKIVELKLNTKTLITRLGLHFIFVIILVIAIVILFIMDDGSGFVRASHVALSWEAYL